MGIRVVIKSKNSQVFPLNLSEERVGEAYEVCFAQLDFIPYFVLQDGFFWREFDRLVCNYPTVVEHRVAKNAHFIQRIAVFPFNSPQSVNEEVIQDEDHVVEEGRLKGFQRGLGFGGCCQSLVGSNILLDLCAARGYVALVIGLMPSMS